MCGRRIEGWRGLLPVPTPAGAGWKSGGAPDTEVPREKERTRQVAPSASLLLSASGMVDEEAMRPTRELPSIGHELRAQAPGHRVLTSPTGNVLPTSFLKALAERTPLSTSEEQERSGPVVAGPFGRVRPQDGAPSAPMPDDATDLIRTSRRAPPRVLAQLLLMALVCATVAVSVSLLAYRLMVGPRPQQAPVPDLQQQPTAMQRQQPASPWHRAQRSPGSYRTRDLVVSIPPQLRRQNERRTGGVILPSGDPTNGAPVFRDAPQAPQPTARAAPQSIDLGIIGQADVGASPQPGPLSPEEAQHEQEAQVAAADIEFVASTNHGQVRACYERAFKGVLAVGGRVELAFTLTEDGRAIEVSTAVNTTGSEALALCLSQRVQEWRFPRPVGGAKAYQFPFVFLATGGAAGSVSPVGGLGGRGP